MALRLATPADAAVDPEWAALVDEWAARMKAEATAFVGCAETSDGMRAFIVMGDPDPDASAGYIARCLARLADSEE